MSNEQIHLNTQERLDDQMMDIDLLPSDGRSAHYAIASVVVRMDGMANDSPDLVSFADRLVSRYNACADMADPAVEIAELKRQRDELLDVLYGIVEEVPHRHGSRGSAPGHAHSLPGIWDSDNGALAGKECGWCKAWRCAVEVYNKSKGGAA